MTRDPPVIKIFLSTKHVCCKETVQVHVPGFETTQQYKFIESWTGLGWKGS